MLRVLHIKNFSIIDDVNIEFGEGFNVLTGETGAGKSIVIDALCLALGERATAEAIRSGETANRQNCGGERSEVKDNTLKGPIRKAS